MTKHFIRYHVQDKNNPIRSGNGVYFAWAKSREKQPNWKPPISAGDVVWLLSGTDVGSRKKTYRLEYYFQVDTNPAIKDGRFLVEGTKGRSFDPKITLDKEPWFGEFFQAIGRGGISFQEIPSQYLPFFLKHFENGTGQHDPIDKAIAAAEESKINPEEVDMLRAIKSRRGQPKFRQALLDAYENRCCVTGCNVVDVLEAAHIVSHSDETDYSLPNGLLLRADIHTLFDLHLIGVDDWDRIKVSPLLKDSEYYKLDGQRVRLPTSLSDRPDRHELANRLKLLVMSKV